MAIKDEEMSENEVKASYTSNELHDEFQKFGGTYVALKKNTSELDAKINVLNKEKDSLKNENNVFINKNLLLEK